MLPGRCVGGSAWLVVRVAVSIPEILERGDPCWLLKLRWMGTQRVQMKGVLPWLPGWACRASTRDFCSAWAALVGLIKNYFCSHRSLHQLFPSPSKLGRQSCRVACLLVCVLCVWSTPLSDWDFTGLKGTVAWYEFSHIYKYIKLVLTFSNNTHKTFF